MSKNTKIERLLDDVVKRVPEALDEAGFPPNQCILATRVGIELLREQGVKARAMPVKLDIVNPVAVALLDAGETRDPEHPEEWDAAGAWGIGIGRGNPDGSHGWDGHVVIIATERYLIDLTAHAAHRPNKSINAAAFWHESKRLARGERVSFDAHDGCVWTYTPDPENRSYLSAIAWTTQYRSIVKEIKDRS